MPRLLESMALSGVTQTDGTPNASGKVWVYVRGTTSLAPVFADADGDAVSSQPVVLDAAGRATIYIDQPVSLHIENAAGATLDDVDVTDSPGPIVVANPAFTGTLPDGSQGAGGETDLNTVLTSAKTSTGGPDFQYQEGTGATPRSLQSWMREVHVSVIDYGADPSATFDSTSAIQAAINRVIALNGGVVYFPPGRYIISAALTNTSNVGVSFVGAGYASCIQQTSASANTFTLSGGSIGFEIASLNLTPSPGTTGAAISLTGGSQMELVTIRDNYITNHKTGIVIAGGVVIDTDIHGNFISTINTSGDVAINIVGTLSRSRIFGNTLFATNTTISYSSGADLTAIFGNSLAANGPGTVLAMPNNVISRPLLFYGNTIFQGVITQAGSVLYVKQWGNGIDGVSHANVTTNVSITPDLTAGPELYIPVTTGGLTVTLPLPALTPVYRGFELVLKLHNNNAGVTTWATSGSYIGSTGSIATTANTMTTWTLVWDVTRSLWIEKARAVTG